jgi:HAD superfamily hydrolase (TIGR01490 family)
VTTTASSRPTLAVFDLDHTLIAGDSDVLWCEFLIAEGVLDRASFEPRNRAIESGYKAGTVGVLEFCEFFVGMLTGRTPAQWAPLRERFMAACIEPRVLSKGLAAIQAHRDAGHTLVMSSATNRFLCELSAELMGFEHLIATECDVDAQGRFSGRVAGEPNMREGKVSRLEAWLAAQGRPPLAVHHSVFYSDSANDLPLLMKVDEPVAVNPDARLAAEAAARGFALRDWR